jgi:O-acetyl-ADP-ribose deacetylase (regulator of RNase III)
MKRLINGVNIELALGNIAAQNDLTAIVNAANAQLMPGGGVAGAIHRAAGPDLARECAALAPITPGTAVITGGHELPNRYVIHCLGPVYRVDEPGPEILSSCYANALRIAEHYEIDSIGFPAISTGIFGYPFQDAALVALKTVLASLPGLRFVKLIRFVLYSKDDLETYETTLSMLISKAKNT